MIGRLVLIADLLSPFCRAEDPRAALHSYFDQSCDKGFIGVVSITVNGEAAYSDACGWADAEWKVLNAADTRFRTGSNRQAIYRRERVALAGRGEVVGGYQ